MRKLRRSRLRERRGVREQKKDREKKRTREIDRGYRSRILKCVPQSHISTVSTTTQVLLYPVKKRRRGE